MLKLWPVLAQFTAPELWVQVEYLVRIFVAACLGLLIGSERKNRNKSAGIRTHVIVALGAALIMVVSKYGFMDVERQMPPVWQRRLSAVSAFWVPGSSLYATIW